MRGGVVRKSLGSTIIVVLDPETDLKPGMVEQLANFRTWDSVKGFNTLHDLSIAEWMTLRHVLNDAVDTVSACGGQHRQAAIRVLLDELQNEYPEALEEVRKARLAYDAYQVRKDPQGVSDEVGEELKADLEATIARAGSLKAIIDESGWWMISVYDRSEWPPNGCFLRLDLTHIDWLQTS